MSFDCNRLKTEVESVCGDRDYLEYSDVVKLSYMMQVRIMQDRATR